MVCVFNVSCIHDSLVDFAVKKMNPEKFKENLIWYH